MVPPPRFLWGALGSSGVLWGCSGELWRALESSGQFWGALALSVEGDQILDNSLGGDVALCDPLHQRPQEGIGPRIRKSTHSCRIPSASSAVWSSASTTSLASSYNRTVSLRVLCSLRQYSSFFTGTCSALVARIFWTCISASMRSSPVSVWCNCRSSSSTSSTLSSKDLKNGG